MSNTFFNWNEHRGPGPRGEPDCPICLADITPTTPALTHRDPVNASLCLYTVCRACFMVWALDGVSLDASCPSCRQEILLNQTPLTQAEDLGTDGRNVGSFWPDFAGVGLNIPLQTVAPDVLNRLSLLHSYNVDLDEYRRNRFLEHAIICRSLESFLDAASSTVPYVRYQYTATPSFVRWLEADREQLRGSFVRWLSKNRKLGKFVRHGMPGRQVPWPAAATEFHLLQLSDDWYLVPETPAADEDDFSYQFWQIGAQIFQKKWTQQSEQIFILPAAYNASVEATVYALRFGPAGFGRPRHAKLVPPPAGTPDVNYANYMTGKQVRLGPSGGLFVRQLYDAFEGFPVCKFYYDH